MSPQLLIIVTGWRNWQIHLGSRWCSKLGVVSDRTSNIRPWLSVPRVLWYNKIRTSICFYTIIGNDRKSWNIFINFYIIHCRFLFPINFLEGIHVDFQRIAGWMTFESRNDYENLIERYNSFPRLVDEISEVMRVSLQRKMTYHSYSMVSKQYFLIADLRALK